MITCWYPQYPSKSHKRGRIPPSLSSFQKKHRLRTKHRLFWLPKTGLIRLHLMLLICGKNDQQVSCKAHVSDRLSRIWSSYQAHPFPGEIVHGIFAGDMWWSDKWNDHVFSITDYSVWCRKQTSRVFKNGGER